MLKTWHRLGFSAAFMYRESNTMNSQTNNGEITASAQFSFIVPCTLIRDFRYRQELPPEISSFMRSSHRSEARGSPDLSRERVYEIFKDSKDGNGC